jgi:GxxExxY protein
MIRRISGLLEQELTHSIIGAFYETYNILGWGFLESVYAAALERELRARGHVVARQFNATVVYKGEDIAWQRLDIVVDEKVALEIKATEMLPPQATRQLHNYLKATNLEVGLVLHYGLKPAFVRLVASNGE